MVLTAAAFLVPVDVMMLGVSNILFLIIRSAGAGSAPDFQLMGRLMLVMLLQCLILIPGLGIPAGVGGLVFWLSGFSLRSPRPSGSCSCWNCRWSCMLASMFERYDPSTETPA